MDPANYFLSLWTQVNTLAPQISWTLGTFSSMDQLSTANLANAILLGLLFFS